jgi:hypothetical protein
LRAEPDLFGQWVAVLAGFSSRVTHSFTTIIVKLGGRGQASACAGTFRGTLAALTLPRPLKLPTQLVSEQVAQDT